MPAPIALLTVLLIVWVCGPASAQPTLGDHIISDNTSNKIA